MVEPDHTARAVWELAGRLDLSGFTAEIEWVEDEGGGRLVKHTRYCGLLPAESHLTRRFCGAMRRRIELLPLPAGYPTGTNCESALYHQERLITSATSGGYPHSLCA